MAYRLPFYGKQPTFIPFSSLPSSLLSLFLLFGTHSIFFLPLHPKPPVVASARVPSQKSELVFFPSPSWATLLFLLAPHGCGLAPRRPPPPSTTNEDPPPPFLAKCIQGLLLFSALIHSALLSHPSWLGSLFSLLPKCVCIPHLILFLPTRRSQKGLAGAPWPLE